MNKEEFEREITLNVSRLVDSYRTLLKKATIEGDDASRHEELQCSTAATSIVHHAQCILDQISEIRMQVVLQTKRNRQS